MGINVDASRFRLKRFLNENGMEKLINRIEASEEVSNLNTNDESYIPFQKLSQNFTMNLENRITETKKAETIGDYIYTLYEDKRREDRGLVARAPIAGISKEYKYKLVNNVLHPSKNKLLCLAVAFKLDVIETEKLLRKAGYTFAENVSDFNTILAFFIEQEVYNMVDIDEILVEYGEKTMSSVE